MIRSTLMGALVALTVAFGFAGVSPAAAEDNGPTLGFGLARNNMPRFPEDRIPPPRYRPYQTQPAYYQPPPPRYYRPPPPRFYRPPPPPLFIAPPRFYRPPVLEYCRIQNVRVTKYDRYGRPYRVVRQVRVCD